eukprot:GHVT01032480.1.p4 GENE.GHVT01032480.1~~GHVT01032480.1.p4  ORF type:complete len:103 (+),score=17.19 GHVT01032480.1:604-912(+)
MSFAMWLLRRKSGHHIFVIKKLLVFFLCVPHPSWGHSTGSFFFASSLIFFSIHPSRSSSSSATSSASSFFSLSYSFSSFFNSASSTSSSSVSLFFLGFQVCF